MVTVMSNCTEASLVLSPWSVECDVWAEAGSVHDDTVAAPRQEADDIERDGGVFRLDGVDNVVEDIRVGAPFAIFI